MSEYLLINISIILIPLILSFEKNLKFYKKLPYYLFSISIVSTAYLVWDSIATVRGDWGFNPEYLTEYYLFSLPVEEILFFITVPYSSLFIYETVRFYIQEKKFAFNKYYFVIPFILFLVNAYLFIDQSYTFTVSLYAASFILISILLFDKLLSSRNFWVTILIMFIPFFIVNYILTSVPIVTYNSIAIWDIRITTIPAEDFIYSFSMIALWILFYEFGKILLRNK
jgi:lycopene cyclase domain-containing protein